MALDNVNAAFLKRVLKVHTPSHNRLEFLFQIPINFKCAAITMKGWGLADELIYLAPNNAVP